MIRQAVIFTIRVPYGNLMPMRLPTADPIQYRAIDPTAPPVAIQTYFCKCALLSGKVDGSIRGAHFRCGREMLACFAGAAPGHDFQAEHLPGVIICPARTRGQRLRVNSFTTVERLDYTKPPGARISSGPQDAFAGPLHLRCIGREKDNSA